MLPGSTDGDVTQVQKLDRLQAIIASAMDAIISIDAAQRVIFFNPAAEQMFGISAPEAMGAPIEQFIPERFRAGHAAHIVRFATTGETGRRMGALGAISALRANGEEFPVEASISQAQVGGERLSTVILRDITERKANEEAQALLAREVDHRAKNILAIVSSLVSLTEAPTREAYAESLAGRIAAMSRAHGLLARGRWKGASLRQVADDELGTYADLANFTCEGPDVKLSPRAVQPVGMLIHELATNAVKYGALSMYNGHVHLSWQQVPGNGIHLSWQESGGPPVTAPAEMGFGTNLIQQIVDNQLCGDFEHHWARDGYRLELNLPESVLQIGTERRPREGRPAMGEPVRQEGASQRTDDSEKLGTLLIVEDEPLLAMQMSKSLEEYGWSVVGVAGSIEDANRILSEKSRPDVAILDVDLGGMPVFPLARSLRRLGIPFLFCTGYEDLGYSQEFANCRAIRKPATVLQLIRGLREAVRGAHGTLTMAPSS
ncbi:putative response regulator receiver protein [Sphingobium sp. SYK-6]|uniref:HWE histidine kinase domain-containing protein n=1 Tax=Sphingobium sp. (strain NBRC 103272 / SYK-6) TaxID=627192 RepID=UPI0002277504|nr:HWE histidine kinase domain-containing protein [Sphingobium sp. SYK-6]BAK67139.1 putative response regulator receiver protein [Sphingobium sp. SYK-6]